MDRFDHSRQEFTPYGLTCELWTPAKMLRPDRHNEIEINRLNEGTLVYLFGGRKVALRARQVAVFWAGVPHQIIDRSDTTPYFVGTLPLAWFLQHQFPQSMVTRVLKGEMLFEPEGAGSCLDWEMFQRWAEDLKQKDADLERIVLLEIEARLHRFARSVALPECEAEGAAAHALVLPGEVPSAVEQMARYIAQHYTEPLTIEAISRSVDLHPNYAMTLFRKTFGTTLTAYLTANRVTHAQRLLVMTDSSVLEIAMESGFGSLSRFNTAFKAVSGCSPRDYRLAHRTIA